MNYFSDTARAAIHLIFSFDNEVYTIAWTSLSISITATLFAAVFALPLGIWVAIASFRGKKLLQHTLNTLMAMPTVMIGLVLYGLLSRQGALGGFGLLYTKSAIAIGQTLLILPIIMNMVMIAVQTADESLLPTLKSLGANTYQQILIIISELRLSLLAAIVTGFGRAIGEVGAAMMLGGNIQGVTRIMTTAIALETSKGNFELGLALGILLLLIAFGVNVLLQTLQGKVH
jgi:tungstate transport system permease protein